METLLGAGADFDVRATSNRCTALHLAADNGHGSIVSALLGAGAEKDARNKIGASSLICAVDRDHGAVVETLLGSGVDVSVRIIDTGATALHMAARGGHAVIVSALLYAGAGKDALDDKGESPLIWAARGDSDVRTILGGPGAGNSFRDSNPTCAANRGDRLSWKLYLEPVPTSTSVALSQRPLST